MSETPAASLTIEDITPHRGSNYPAPFHEPCSDRSKWVLGDVFGLNNFGVNLVELHPGAWSSQRHWHSHEDELVFVLEGELCLIQDEGETVLKAGSFAGFPAGKANGHHLINRSDKPARYLEIGARNSEDDGHYPDIDMEILKRGKGGWFTHLDGRPYPR